MDAPPLMANDDPGNPRNQSQWAGIDPADLPSSENMAMVRERGVAFWKSELTPKLGAGLPLLISSHGNTLRALLMALGDMSVADVEALEIPTGLPIVFSFSTEGEPIRWRYLGSTAPKAA